MKKLNYQGVKLSRNRNEKRRIRKMNGQRYKDALPYCMCGCGQKVNKFTAKYLPGHHVRGAKGEKTSFYGRTHGKFARLAISAGLKKRNEERMKIINVKNIDDYHE